MSCSDTWTGVVLVCAAVALLNVVMAAPAAHLIILVAVVIYLNVIVPPRVASARDVIASWVTGSVASPVDDFLGPRGGGCRDTTIRARTPTAGPLVQEPPVNACDGRITDDAARLIL